MKKKSMILCYSQLEKEELNRIQGGDKSSSTKNDGDAEAVTITPEEPDDSN